MTRLLLIGLLAAFVAPNSVRGQTYTMTKLNLSGFPFISGTSDTTLATVTNSQIPASKAVKIYANRHLGGRPLATTAPTTGQVIGWDGATWKPIAVSGGGGGGAVNVTARLSGDGSLGSPLDIAQQGAEAGAVLRWSGATWVPSAGSPYTYVVASSTIAPTVNTVLIGTLPANITLGLPDCNSANDTKQFLFQRTGAGDAFSFTVDPSGAQDFNDGSLTKIIFGSGLEFQCTCRFASGTGKWFYNF